MVQNPKNKQKAKKPSEERAHSQVNQMCAQKSSGDCAHEPLHHKDAPKSGVKKQNNYNAKIPKNQR